MKRYHTKCLEQYTYNQRINNTAYIQFLYVYKQPSYCWEIADDKALSGIAMQNANDSYSRLGNFDDLLVPSMF